MDIITIHDAETLLLQLLGRVEAGEEIVLARGKEPVAKLIPFRPPPIEGQLPKRQFGAMRGLI